MLNDDELFEKCKTDEPITNEDLGIKVPESIDGMVYECGGYTIYKTKDGYRHCDGKPVTWLQKKLFGLED
jgi:hypothetical protein